MNYQDPSIIFDYAVTYFDGTVTKRQWFFDAGTAQRFGKAMKALEFSNVQVQQLVDL